MRWCPLPSRTGREWWSRAGCADDLILQKRPTEQGEPGCGDSCERPCRVLEARVDALVLAYVVDFERDGRGPAPGGEVRAGFLRAIGRAARRAKKTRHAEGFRWGTLVAGDLRPPKRPGLYVIDNAECTITIDRDARESLVAVDEPAWNVVVEWRAASLATRGWDVHLSAKLAGELGWVRAERLRRVDLAATLTGYGLAADEADRLVLRSRAKVERWNTAEGFSRRADATIAVHGSALRATGYTVSPGNPILARVYDKAAELTAKREIARARDGRFFGITPKGKIELAAWRRRGVVLEHGHDVVRVEFQVRGEALDDFDLRNPGDLEARIGGLWRYLTGETDAEKPDPATGKPRTGAWKGWMRIVAPTTRGEARKKRRAALDPRWAIVREVEFPGAARAEAPAKRSPRLLRRGAHYLQALGATLSNLAAAGTLPKVPTGPWDPETYAARNSELSCERFVAHHAELVARAAAETWTEQLIADKGARGAAAWWAAKAQSLDARFAAIAFDSAEAEYERRVAGPSAALVFAEQQAARATARLAKAAWVPLAERPKRERAGRVARGAPPGGAEWTADVAVA